MKANATNLSIHRNGINVPPVRVEPSHKSRRPAASAPRLVPAKKAIPSSPVIDVAKHKKPRTKNVVSLCAPTIPIPVDQTMLKTLQSNSGLLTRALSWIRNLQSGGANNRRLQVAATASLGEKRFVAVIRVDGLEFLIGGGATNIALLAQLDGKRSFADLLRETMTAQKTLVARQKIELASEQA